MIIFAAYNEIVAKPLTSLYSAIIGKKQYHKRLIQYFALIDHTVSQPFIKGHPASKPTFPALSPQLTAVAPL